MGSKKQPKQPVGQAVFATFALAVASKIDEFQELWIGDNKISTFNTESNISKMNTGIKSTQYPSNAGLSKIISYFGDNKFYNAYMAAKTGFKLKYKKVAYLFFEDAFMGDNVNSIPNYKIKVKRTNILGWYKNGELLDDINGEANPAVVLYHMLTELGKIEESLIDKNSFIDIAIKLKNEGFGLSFSITSSDTMKKWIEEILRHIDGSLYFDTLIGKYTLRIIRYDYNINELILLDDSNTKDVKMKKPDWNTLATNLTLEYTSNDNFKKTSINKENLTVKKLSNKENNQIVTMMAITNQELAKTVLNRELKKYSYPLFNVTMKIPNNLHFKPLDVIKFSNKVLGIENMVLRIMEIGADDFEKNYYEIKCVEDIFNAGDFDLTDVQQPKADLKDYNINFNMKLLSQVVKLNRDMLSSENPEILFLDNADDNSKVTFDTITSNGVQSNQKIENYTKLKQDLLFQDTYENGGIGYNYIEDKIILERQSYMVEHESTDEDYQKGQYSVSINGEIIVYKSLKFIDDFTVSINECIRNINNIEVSSYYIEDIVWFINTEYSTINFENHINGKELEFNVTLNNDFNSSNKFYIQTENYDDFYIKPYKVEQVIWDKSTGNVSFYPTYFRKENGASYQDPDTITFNSADENKVEENQIFYITAKYKVLASDTDYIIYENYSQDLSVDTGILGSYEVIEYFYLYNIINNKKSLPYDILNT